MKYVFKPYSKSFSELFEKEKRRIADCIPNTLNIEHVGSTAVPNLGGKGIIDIAVAAHRAEIDSITKELQCLGYELRPLWSTPERLFFRIDLPDLEEGIRRYHLHLMLPDSKDWTDMIAFRDYLIKHPEEASKYADLKQQAAKEVNEDGEKYRKLKDPTFKRILAKIKEEKEID